MGGGLFVVCMCMSSHSGWFVGISPVGFRCVESLPAVCIHKMLQVYIEYPSRSTSLPPTLLPLPSSPAPSLLIVRGSEYEEAVSNLMAMGFERDQVVRALHASFNNPDRAVEYLMSVSPC